MIEFEELFQKFRFEGHYAGCRSYGSGHINGTYAMEVTEAPVRRYLLQRINPTLFSDVPALMRNIRLVTEHIRAKVRARGGNPDRGTLTLIPTADGADAWYDGEAYWRAYRFIENATGYTVADNVSMYAAGVGFGRFANDLADFDASVLTDVLPDFHNTAKRYRDFSDALRRDAAGRSGAVAEEIAFLQAHRKYADFLTTKIETGILPLRVTLNDTKLDNVLIDNETREAIAVIDLDTVMKGSLCTDFGDAIRFGCNSAAEDEPDLSKVRFRTEHFTAFCRGYLGELWQTVTSAELDSMADAAIVITYEQALRFLADYLDGDVYYHTSREGQNLDRARTQMKLIDEMEQKLETLRGIVRSEFARAEGEGRK